MCYIWISINFLLENAHVYCCRYVFFNFGTFVFIVFVIFMFCNCQLFQLPSFHKVLLLTGTLFLFFSFCWPFYICGHAFSSYMPVPLNFFLLYTDIICAHSNLIWTRFCMISWANPVNKLTWYVDVFCTLISHIAFCCSL